MMNQFLIVEDSPFRTDSNDLMDASYACVSVRRTGEGRIYSRGNL